MRLFRLGTPGFGSYAVTVSLLIVFVSLPSLGAGVLRSSGFAVVDHLWYDLFCFLLIVGIAGIVLGFRMYPMTPMPSEKKVC